MGTHSFRTDKNLEKELSYIQDALGANQTQAIKESIHSLYTRLRKKEKEKKSALDIFENLGLIGSFEGEADLSESYKKVILKSIEDKHHGNKK